MTKIEFLNKLRKKLEILDPGEVEDILKEYSGYIDEKIENGVIEEEAIESFGNIDELANELLKAYKINVKEEKDPIGDFSKKILSIVDQFVDNFSSKSFREILKFILEICIILFIIALCHIPVSMLVNLGKDVFYILSSPLNRIFFHVWNFILEFAYFILSIIVFIRIFEKRYIKEENIIPFVSASKAEEKKSKKRSELSKKRKGKVDSKIYCVGKFFIKVFVFFLKFVSICILFVISCYLIGMTFVVGICIYLLFRGVFYFGLYLVMFALFFLGILFFEVLFNFVVDRKNNGLKLFVSILISILMLGGGCAMASFEVAETEFINGVPSDLQLETMSEELSMTKDTVFIGNIAGYNVDNSLETVKVDYEYYPLGTEMSTKVVKTGDSVYLNWTLERFKFKSEILNHIINDLKEKKVYNYSFEPTITITANEENIEIIKKNRQKYYQNETNYNACEFVRTYYVEMIKDAHTEEEKVVILSEYLNDNLVSVRLKSSIANQLVVGNTYEFTFKTYQSYIDADIEDVFDENEVISAVKTDKLGVAQRQDSSCTIFY